MKRTLLFFDLDDTILKNPMVDAVFPAIFKQFRSYHPELTDEILWKEINSILLPRYHARKIEAFDWDDLIQRVAKKYGIPFDTPIEKMIEENAHVPYIKIFDHVHETLEALKKDNRFVLAIGTNGHWRYQKPSVKALGLLEYFDYVCTPDRTGYLKGSQGFYASALNGSQLQITIGDQYDADVEEPLLLGFHSIWRPAELPAKTSLEQTPFQRAQLMDIPAPYTRRPDAVITGFSELLPVIDEIDRQFFLN
jgi:FMN phosphatase YigB (HAD superfamily)